MTPVEPDEQWAFRVAASVTSAFSTEPSLKVDSIVGWSEGRAFYCHQKRTTGQWTVEEIPYADAW